MMKLEAVWLTVGRKWFVSLAAVAAVTWLAFVLWGLLVGAVVHAGTAGVLLALGLTLDPEPEQSGLGRGKLWSRLAKLVVLAGIAIDAILAVRLYYFWFISEAQTLDLNSALDFLVAYWPAVGLALCWALVGRRDARDLRRDLGVPRSALIAVLAVVTVVYAMLLLIGKPIGA